MPDIPAYPRSALERVVLWTTLLPPRLVAFCWGARFATPKVLKVGESSADPADSTFLIPTPTLPKDSASGRILQRTALAPMFPRPALHWTTRYCLGSSKRHLGAAGGLKAAFGKRLRS
jgi:hypothetical protein